MWLKIAEKTNSKYKGNFQYMYKTNCCINLLKKTTKSILYVLRCFFGKFCNNLSYISFQKFSVCFAVLFLSNLCNNLSYILYRKFPICSALQFLANLSNNLSYIITKKFLIYFASVFSAVLKHLFVLYTYRKFLK